jgi:Glycosyltransferase like family
MADPNSDDSGQPLTFVACVSDDEILGANLLASPCLKPGSPHELILVKNSRSAADGLNLGIARARHELVVCLHQDVHLPPGWDRRLIRQLDAATRQWGPIGVAGVYGVGDPKEVRPDAPPTSGDGEGAADRQPRQQAPKFAVQRTGRVIHRGHPLFDSPSLPARVSTLDELLLVVPSNTLLRFDPDLGFHLYGADICMMAQEHGFAVVALDAACHHNSRTAILPRAFFQSAGVFADKWRHRLPVATSCVVIDQRKRVWVLGSALPNRRAGAAGEERPPQRLSKSQN